MSTAKTEKRDEAIILRQSGMSIKKIAAEIECAASSVCGWVKHVKLTDDQVAVLSSMSHGGRKHLKAAAAIKKKCADCREIYREEGRQAARMGDVQHAIACSLYWAEGSKKVNSVCLPNTDPKMVKLFYDFMVKNFDKEPKIEFSYHQDEGNAPELDARMFWAQLLGVDVAAVHSFANKDKRVRSGSRKKRHLNGMCIISVFSVQAVQHIYGALEVYGDVFICN